MNKLSIFLLITCFSFAAEQVVEQEALSEQTFEQSYVTCVADDGEGDFWLGYKSMQHLAQTLSPTDLKKILFLFLIVGTTQNHLEHVQRFRERFSPLLSPYRNVYWFIGTNHHYPDIDVCDISAEGLPFEPRFPTFKQQQVPVLHVVGATSCEMGYLPTFYSQRSTIFHGEMGSSIGMQRENALFYILRNYYLLNQEIRRHAMQLLFSTNSAEVLNSESFSLALLTLNSIFESDEKDLKKATSTLQSLAMVWDKIDPRIQADCLSFLSTGNFSPSLRNHQYCGFGFGSELIEPVTQDRLEQKGSVKTAAPGYGVLLKTHSLEKERSKENVFRWVQEEESYRKFLKRTVDPQKTHIIFCTNSRVYGSDLQIIVDAIKVHSRFNKSPLLLIVKHNEKDISIPSNAQRVFEMNHPFLTMIPVSERISHDLYNDLIMASTVFVTAGDNALMDAFSFGVWPLHLYHQTLCKTRETMFPVAQSYRKTMIEEGVAAGFEIILGVNALRKLGTNILPSEEESRFYREIICPHIKRNFDYGQKLLSVHMHVPRAARALELDQRALEIELN